MSNFDSTKWGDWMASCIAKKGKNKDSTEALLEGWSKRFVEAEKKDILEGVKVLKFLQVNHAAGEVKFFRKRMITQLDLCCFDDKYTPDMERWKSLILDDLKNGIGPAELDAWHICYIPFPPEVYSLASEVYNSGLPLDPKIPVVPFFHDQKRPEKYRIGFLAGGWGCHTTTYLTRGLIRCLDRERFDVWFLVGEWQDHQDDVCREDMKKLAHWENLPDLNTDTAATFELIKSLELDFLVDCLGPAFGSRGEAFPYRPAKVGVNWLAHPGSCGNKGLQYIVVDPVLASTDDTREWWTEKRAFMERTYFNGDHAAQFPHLKSEMRVKTSANKTIVLHGSSQLPYFLQCPPYPDQIWDMLENDGVRYTYVRGHQIWNGLRLPKKKVSAGYDILRGFVATTREQFGLPEDALVLASFNNQSKHTLETVDLWFDIMLAVPNSVLWVAAYPAEAKHGLEQRMIARGLDKNRLIMVKDAFTSKELYLRRACLCNLMLDPLTYNGHTCSYDAIFVGCPVLTLCGNSFQSRVTASFLRVLKLQCLVTYSKQEYLERAVFLAQHPMVLDHLRIAVLLRKGFSPLLDASVFAEEFESLLDRMFDQFIAHPNDPEKWEELLPLGQTREWMTPRDFDTQWMTNFANVMSSSIIAVETHGMSMLLPPPPPSPDSTDTALSMSPPLSPEAMDLSLPTPPPRSPIMDMTPQTPHPRSPSPPAAMDLTQQTPPPRSPSPSPPLPPDAMDISPVAAPSVAPPPQNPALPERNFLFPRILPIFAYPSFPGFSDDLFFIGQRITNIAYLQTAAGYCLESLQAKYQEGLWIGLIQAAQFISRFCAYMSLGLPKFPRRPGDNYWDNFFCEPQGLLHSSTDQYFMTRSFIGNDGLMKEPAKIQKILSELNAAGRKNKERCFECLLGYEARQIDTLRDVHGPDAHSWKGRKGKQKACTQCEDCGIPKSIFLSDEDFDLHVENHKAQEVEATTCESYRPVTDTTEVDGQELRYHPFHVDCSALVQNPGYLGNECLRYCDAGLTAGFEDMYFDKSWHYYPGQRMVTFLWLKEAVEQALDWMKRHIGLVAASGCVVRQFLDLLDLNLNTVGCPFIPNLAHMDPQIRIDFCQKYFKFTTPEMYDLLMKIFDNKGGMDEGKMANNTPLSPGQAFCKLCKQDVRGGANNVRQKLKQHHILPDNQASCSKCGFLFKPSFADMGGVKTRHAAMHSNKFTWQERVTDDQVEGGNVTHATYLINPQ